MHERLNIIKSLLQNNEYEKAMAFLIAYRIEFPDDWDGKLMAGFIAQLRGDEKTFRRIYDEAQDFIQKATAIQSSTLWEKYRRLIQKANGDNEKTEVPMEEEESTDNTIEEDTVIDDDTTDINQYLRVLYGSPEYMNSLTEKNNNTRKKTQRSTLSFRNSASSNEEPDEPTSSNVPNEPYEGDLYAGPEYMDLLIEAKENRQARKTIAPSRNKHDIDKTVISKDDDGLTSTYVSDPNYKENGHLTEGVIPDEVVRRLSGVIPDGDMDGKSSDQPGPLYKACQYLARLLWKLSGKFKH